LRYKLSVVKEGSPTYSGDMPKQYDWNFLKDIGKRVALLRKKTGISQEELAERANLHRTYIGFIEQGKRDPSVGNLNKIVAALGATMDELFSIQPSGFAVEDKPNPKKKP
jgi:transcriptional regulator with XRE-family HTH domain